MSEPGPDVSVQQAADAAAAGHVLLVDVRDEQEWTAGHAPLALHVPLGVLTAGMLPVCRPVVAVCRSGNRSGTAAAALAQEGIEVANMVGGMKAWAAAGLPVVVADGRPGEIT